MQFWETYDECVSTMLDLKELDTPEVKTGATDLDKLKYYVYQLECHNTPPYDLSFIGNEQLRNALEEYFETNKSDEKKLLMYPTYIIEFGNKLRGFWGLSSDRWDVTLPSDVIENDKLLIENEKLNDKLESTKRDSKDYSRNRWGAILDGSIKKDDLILENERLRKKIAELKKNR